MKDVSNLSRGTKYLYTKLFSKNMNQFLSTVRIFKNLIFRYLESIFLTLEEVKNIFIGSNENCYNLQNKMISDHRYRELFVTTVKLEYYPRKVEGVTFIEFFEKSIIKLTPE